VCLREYDRAVREMPKYKLSAATEAVTADVTALQQDAGRTAAEVTEEIAKGSTNVEATQSNSDQPASDVTAPAPSAAPDRRTSASQKGSTQSSSEVAYLRAIMPSFDAIIAENDFSSDDARKR